MWIIDKPKSFDLIEQARLLFPRKKGVFWITGSGFLGLGLLTRSGGSGTRVLRTGSGIKLDIGLRVGLYRWRMKKEIWVPPWRHLRLKLQIDPAKRKEEKT